MTLREFKQSNIYQQATDITYLINGTDDIEPMYYPEELDGLDVIFTGADEDGNVNIGLACSNWESRYEPGWIAQSE